MTQTDPLKEEMGKLLKTVKQFFMARRNGDSLEKLNSHVHGMRLAIHQILMDHFMPLSWEEGLEFQAALVDALTNMVLSLDPSGRQQIEEYHHYCIGEILVCFRWAQQIKEEIPDDPMIQKMLAIDIPILRPFDYGSRKTAVSRPAK